MPKTWTKIRSEIAVAKRLDPRADTTDLQRELKEARLAEYVQRAIASAPPLTAEQRDRLALILTADSTRRQGVA